MLLREIMILDPRVKAGVYGRGMHSVAEFVIRRRHIRVGTDRFYEDPSVIRNLDEECDRRRRLLVYPQHKHEFLRIETQTLQLSNGHFCRIEFAKICLRSENILPLK